MDDIRDRLKPGNFLRTGHRGARGICPENTMMAFHRASEIGVDIIELDVQSTSDGRIVVLHDETVDRTTDGHGEIAKMTYAAAQRLDAGFGFAPPGFPHRGKGIRIPLLEDVLTSFPQMAFTIEMKSSPFPHFLENLSDVIRRAAPRRVIAASESMEQLRRIRAILPDVPTNLSRAEVRRFYFMAKVGLGIFSFLRGSVFQVPTYAGGDARTGFRVVTHRFVRAAHRLGIPVQVWTVNDPAEMRELIDMGVDGITTDRPDILNAVIGGGRK